MSLVPPFFHWSTEQIKIMCLIKRNTSHPETYSLLPLCAKARISTLEANWPVWVIGIAGWWRTLILICVNIRFSKSICFLEVRTNKALSHCHLSSSLHFRGKLLEAWQYIITIAQREDQTDSGCKYKTWTTCFLLYWEFAFLVRMGFHPSHQWSCIFKYPREGEEFHLQLSKRRILLMGFFLCSSCPKAAELQQVGTKVVNCNKKYLVLISSCCKKG